MKRETVDELLLLLTYLMTQITDLSLKVRASEQVLEHYPTVNAEYQEKVIQEKQNANYGQCREALERLRAKLLQDREQ
jgi:hypothetical protein